jgi:hypothetical protein
VKPEAGIRSLRDRTAIIITSDVNLGQRNNLSINVIGERFRKKGGTAMACCRYRLEISRRSVLYGVAAAGGLATGVAAQTKASQALVHYQNNPKGDARCDNCIQWQPPDACKVVEGKISPAGWCNIYAPKPKA